jgi:hypothetical protein
MGVDHRSFEAAQGFPAAATLMGKSQQDYELVDATEFPADFPG